MPLGRKVASGAVWLLIARIGGQVFGLASTIIVARFLLPDDYGVFAAAMSLMMVIAVFGEFPVSQAIVQLSDANDDDYDTAFTINLLRSLAVALVLVLLAAPLASFMNDARVGPVTAALAIYTFVLGLRNPRVEWFARQMDFSKEAFIEIGSKLAQFLFSVGFAIYLKSYWAIVIGISMGAATQLVLSHLVRPAIPRFTLKSFNRLFSYSAWMAGQSILGQVYQLIDTLTLGRLAGAATLAAYSIGTLLSGRISEVISIPAARSLFAAFSIIQSDLNRLAHACLNSMAFMAFFVTPIAVTMTVFAEPIILLVLGDKWQSAIPVARIMALITLGLIVWTPLQAVLMGTGRTRTLFLRAAVFVTLYLSLAVWSVHTHGLVGLMISKLIFVGGFMLVDFTLVRACVGLSYVRQAGTLVRPAIGAAAMVLVYGALGGLVPEGSAILGVGVPLALISLCGGAAYLLVVLGVWHLLGQPDGIERKCAGAATKIIAYGSARAFQRRGAGS